MTKAFRNLLLGRYADFAGPPHAADPIQLTVDLKPPRAQSEEEEDLRVFNEAGRWFLRRGDFDADTIRSGGAEWSGKARTRTVSMQCCALFIPLC